MNLPTIALPKISTEVDLSRWISFGAPVGAILISFIILLFIIWPKFTQILQLKSDNQELAGRVQNLNLKAQKLASFDKDSLDLQLGASEQLLPSDKGVFSLVTQIERISAASFNDPGATSTLLRRTPEAADILSICVTKEKTPLSEGKSCSLAPSFKSRDSLSKLANF